MKSMSWNNWHYRYYRLAIDNYQKNFQYTQLIILALVIRLNGEGLWIDCGITRIYRDEFGNPSLSISSCKDWPNDSTWLDLQIFLCYVTDFGVNKHTCHLKHTPWTQWHHSILNEVVSILVDSDFVAEVYIHTYLLHQFIVTIHDDWFNAMKG